MTQKQETYFRSEKIIKDFTVSRFTKAASSVNMENLPIPNSTIIYVKRNSELKTERG